LQSLKDNFSAEQLLAIDHFNGPALVVAGPGSGKTTVIVNRIYNLIYKRHIQADNILVVTFSKAAALSMQSRFNQIYGYQPVHFGTFHSVFYNIIKENSISHQFKVVNYSTKISILTDVINSLTKLELLQSELMDSILKRISFYKNSGLKKDNCELCRIDDDLFINIFRLYSDALKTQDYIDFDDMMLLCKELLQSNESIREIYRNKFRYILVDEFQDINDLQYEILKKLIYNDNIFAVGDDDQSIYGFRGSNPDIMQSFSSDFPNTRLIKLSCNYRSHETIVNAAFRLIANNHNRFKKDIYAGKECKGKIVIKAFETIEDENTYICDILNSKKDKGTNTAILFRSNHGLNNFVELMAEKKIHINVSEKLDNPYDNQVFNDFIHYFNMSKSLDDIKTEDFIPVMNKPVRYINRNSVMSSYVDFSYLRGFYKEKAYVQKNIKKLEYDLKQMMNMDAYSAFNYFCHVIGYEEYIMKECALKQDLLKKYINDMETLRERIRHINDMDELLIIANRLKEINSQKNLMNISHEGLYAMTFHASKGLEFNHVIIPYLMEGDVPSSKSISLEAVEEERRMLYVAMTRAKNELYMTYEEGNKNNIMLVSRFVKELL